MLQSKKSMRLLEKLEAIMNQTDSYTSKKGLFLVSAFSQLK